MRKDHAEPEFITIERRDTGVAILTMNRPEILNAINWQMHEEIEQALYALDMDPAVKAVVLTGAGRGFCSGGDQNAVDTGMPSVTRGGRHLVRNLLELEVPIIAAVNGVAVGLGATLALYCDAVFAQPSARFADTHVNAGVVAGDGGQVIWPMLMGPIRAKHYLMTGAFLSAEEAYQFGMVTRLVAEGPVRDEAIRYADLLASGPPEAIKWTKYAVNKLIKDQVQLGLDIGLALEALTFDLPGRREAAAAFAAKKKRYAE